MIDGMDGSGKGTQIKLLKEKLAGKPVLFTREPGGSSRAEEIRELLLREEGPQSNTVCDFFLFWAARGSHIHDVIVPAREAGTHVISDRYDSSTYAFQVWGEESHSWLEFAFEVVRNMAVTTDYHPDLYVILDLPPEVAFERRKSDATQAKSRFDTKPVTYHERVQGGFRRFANKFGSTVFVDANRTPEEIHADMWEIVSRELGYHIHPVR